jgi:nucleotide-binding universal stress UspA family protein
MKRWRRILVPTDFSPCALAALDLAIELAAEANSTLILQHATERPRGLDPSAQLHVRDSDAPVETWVHERVRPRLEALAAPLRARGLAVELRSDVGRASPAILAAIDASAADLVVLGTHGRAGLALVLLGSVAEEVVQKAPVPVLTVRGPCAATERADDELQHQLDAETQG